MLASPLRSTGSPLPPHPTDAGGPEVVAGFLAALAALDFTTLETLLAPDVWFRALMTRRLHETMTAEEAVDAFRSWFGDAPAFRMLHRDHHTLAGREYLAYRIRLRPDWAPDQWHVIEQVAFCRVVDGRITRIDLSCSGYFPTD